MTKNIRKEKEKEFKQQYIIESAMKLFGEKGFENTTMSDIAEAAGFAKGTLYLYFENKDDLLIAVKGEILESFLKNLTEITDREISALDKMREIQASYINLHFNQLLKLGLMEITANCQNLPRMLQKHEFMFAIKKRVARFTECFAKIIQQGQSEGTFKKDLNPAITAMLIDAQFFGVMKKIVMDKEQLEAVGTTREKLLVAAFDFVIAGMRV